MDIKIITWKETDMRFLATGEEMQKIDQISIEQIGKKIFTDKNRRT